MTRIVYATWGHGIRLEYLEQLYERAVQVPVDSVLTTRSAPTEITRCIRYSQMCPKAIDLWLDSGAFTAWTCGVTYTAQDYLEWVQRLLPKLTAFRRVFVMSLDKIPGQYRQPVTSQDIQEATQQTLDNTQYLIDNGLNVVPIHHQGEPLWVMEEYLKMVEYVGISPANDAPLPSRLDYIRSLIPLFSGQSIIKPTHNFGNTSVKQLQTFPFYSADSQSWKQGAIAFGRDFEMALYGKRKADHRMVKRRVKDNPVPVLWENIQSCLKCERELRKLWMHRGIQWQEPKGIEL